MMGLLVTIIILAVAIFLIWKSSDWMTDSLVPVAKKLGTSYIAITTLIVSLILSMPEIFSSVYALLLGHIEIGIGVVIGSVMCNIGLIVGLSAVVSPLSVDKKVVIRDGIFLIIVAIIVGLFGSDLKYQRTEGIILLLLFIPYAINVWFFEKWQPSTKKHVHKLAKNLSLIGHWKRFKIKPSMLTFFISAAVLLFGSYLFSVALIQLNDILQMPEILVGLIFGAIGTAMPNIAAALSGTIKGYKDAAITETFGSNIVTLLITLGIIVVMAPFAISGRVFYFDLTWMVIMNILLVAFIARGYYYKQSSITRFEGVVLLLFYLALLVIQVIYF
jgi:cation:H+ antiporter